MAFSKTAKAKIVKSDISYTDWNGIAPRSMRVAANNNLIKEYSPDQYLFSHCTIMSSVDVDENGPKNDRGWSYRITPETQCHINSNFDSWERKLLLATYQTFIGAESYIEHIQIKELSKGKIIDAVARDIGSSLYIDILVANDRKHTELINSIVSGEISTLSMGCSVSYCTCTKCGNVAHDDTDLCQCIKYMKGNVFYDEKGQKNIICELCGVSSDPKSCTFIEASWVENPAFKGAVMRNILSIDSSDTAMGEQIKAAFSIQREDPTGKIKKSYRLLKADDGFNFDDMGSEGSDDSGDGGDDEDKKKDNKKTIADLTDELKEYLKGKALSELKEEMSQKPQKADTGSENTNENLIRSSLSFPDFKQRYASYSNSLSLYRIYEGLVSVRTAGWKSLPIKGFTGKEILALSHFIATQNNLPTLNKKDCDAIIKVGGTQSFAGPKEYLVAIAKTAGIKKMSLDAAKSLIDNGNLYSMGIDVVPSGISNG